MKKTGTERLTTGGGPRYVVAMVLGTALSTLGPAAPASADAPDSVRAVSDISRYCAACWRNARLHPDCWTDCTQEVFTRLLERVSPDTWFARTRSGPALKSAGWSATIGTVVPPITSASTRDDPELTVAPSTQEAACVACPRQR